MDFWLSMSFHLEFAWLVAYKFHFYVFQVVAGQRRPRWASTAGTSAIWPAMFLDRCTPSVTKSSSSKASCTEAPDPVCVSTGTTLFDFFFFFKIYSVHVNYTIVNWTWWCFVNRCLLLGGQFKSTKSGWQRYSLSGRLSGKVSHCVVQCHCALTPSFQVFYSQHTCCITPACLHHFSSSYTAVLYATSSQCQYAKKHGHSTSTRIHWWTWIRWTHNGIQHFLAWKMTRSSMQLLYWHRRISPDLCCYCCFEFIVTIVTSETLTTLMKWDL